MENRNGLSEVTILTEDMIISPSGATATCPFCGTMYDLHNVDILEICPPVGDGCEFCDFQEMECDD